MTRRQIVVASVAWMLAAWLYIRYGLIRPPEEKDVTKVMLLMLPLCVAGFSCVVAEHFLAKRWHWTIRGLWYGLGTYIAADTKWTYMILICLEWPPVSRLGALTHDFIEFEMGVIGGALVLEALRHEDDHGVERTSL